MILFALRFPLALPAPGLHLLLTGLLGPLTLLDLRLPWRLGPLTLLDLRLPRRLGSLTLLDLRLPLLIWLPGLSLGLFHPRLTGRVAPPRPLPLHPLLLMPLDLGPLLILRFPLASEFLPLLGRRRPIALDAPVS